MSNYYSFNSSRSINRLTDPVRLPDAVKLSLMSKAEQIEKDRRKAQEDAYAMTRSPIVDVADMPAEHQALYEEYLKAKAVVDAWEKLYYVSVGPNKFHKVYTPEEQNEREKNALRLQHELYDSLQNRYEALTEFALQLRQTYAGKRGKGLTPELEQQLSNI